MGLTFSKFSNLGIGEKPPSPNPTPSVPDTNQLFEPTHSFSAGYATIRPSYREISHILPSHRTITYIDCKILWHPSSHPLPGFLETSYRLFQFWIEILMCINYRHKKWVRSDFNLHLATCRSKWPQVTLEFYNSYIHWNFVFFPDIASAQLIPK